MPIFVTSFLKTVAIELLMIARMAAMRYMCINIHGLRTRILGGGFHGTKSLFGKTTAGFLGGFDQRVGGNWTIQADWISGDHDLGYLVPGVAYAIRRHWRISAGYQLPNPGSAGFRGIVFQLSRS